MVRDLGIGSLAIYSVTRTSFGPSGFLGTSDREIPVEASLTEAFHTYKYVQLSQRSLCMGG